MQGGPWAALFLLTVILSATIITVMWRALQEADRRACNARTECDIDIRKISEERIKELKAVVEAMNAYNRVMTDQAKAIESRASAITEMKEALTKIGIIIEAHQKNMNGVADRAEKTLQGLSEKVSAWPARFMQGPRDVP